MERIQNPHQLAIITLQELEERGDFLREVLDFHLRKNDLNILDQGLYTELVYGTVRMRRNLDYILSLFSSRPLKKVDPHTLHILRTALYQILYLDRVPQAAAVNEAVELARRFGHEGVAKFTNGLLRQAIRKQHTIAYPSLEEDPVEHIGLRYSFPSWIVQMWVDQWGSAKTAALCQSMNEPPDMHIRVNTLKTSPAEVRSHFEEQGAMVKKGRYAPEVLEVSPAHLVVGDPWLNRGMYYIQDESSSLAAHALQVEPGQRVYDLCSAPGGKTTHLALLMENQGHILALDVNASRLDLVKENAQKLGVSIIETRLGDASRDLALPPACRVLVDAPCSGLGTMRHRPDIRWRKTPREVQELASLQKKILGAAANYVSPGGLLLYSTCTLTLSENEDVAGWFLDTHPAFQGHSLPNWLPNAQELPWMRTFFPDQHGLDGFFVSSFIRDPISPGVANESRS
ncbi:MAG TPA: 16S rRNA (cytosine(967)-C(5))-methyltransferase RsmB [Firmicutes bacterium]|nr:16S rRNA (cytosine(967)-C(5))-methyltransferase RsmB [Bacillota bacterium]